MGPPSLYEFPRPFLLKSGPSSGGICPFSGGKLQKCPPPVGFVTLFAGDLVEIHDLHPAKTKHPLEFKAILLNGFDPMANHH